MMAFVLVKSWDGMGLTWWETGSTYMCLLLSLLQSHQDSIMGLHPNDLFKSSQRPHLTMVRWILYPLIAQWELNFNTWTLGGCTQSICKPEKNFGLHQKKHRKTLESDFLLLNHQNQTSVTNCYDWGHLILRLTKNLYLCETNRVTGQVTLLRHESSLGTQASLDHSADCGSVNVDTA
jgi:hypothetical protein